MTCENCKRLELELAKAQAAIAQQKSDPIRYRVVDYNDTTALDEAIAEAVDKETRRCHLNWAKARDEAVAAAQQPLVDALDELLETSSDVTIGVFPTEAHLHARRKTVALAKVKEGK